MGNSHQIENAMTSIFYNLCSDGLFPDLDIVSPIKKEWEEGYHYRQLVYRTPSLLIDGNVGMAKPDFDLVLDYDIGFAFELKNYLEESISDSLFREHVKQATKYLSIEKEYLFGNSYIYTSFLVYPRDTNIKQLVKENYDLLNNSGVGVITLPFERVTEIDGEIKLQYRADGSLNTIIGRVSKVIDEKTLSIFIPSTHFYLRHIKKNMEIHHYPKIYYFEGEEGKKELIKNYYNKIFGEYLDNVNKTEVDVKRKEVDMIGHLEKQQEMKEKMKREYQSEYDNYKESSYSNRRKKSKSFHSINTQPNFVCTRNPLIDIVENYRENIFSLFNIISGDLVYYVKNGYIADYLEINVLNEYNKLEGIVWFFGHRRAYIQDVKNLVDRKKLLEITFFLVAGEGTTPAGKKELKSHSIEIVKNLDDIKLSGSIWKKKKKQISVKVETISIEDDVSLTNSSPLVAHAMFILQNGEPDN